MAFEVKFDLSDVSNNSEVVATVQNKSGVLAYMDDILSAGYYLGYYLTSALLISSHPTANDGSNAEVGETGTIWLWDINTNDWIDSGNPITTIFPNSVGVVELKDAFTKITDLGDVSGTVNIDWALAGRYLMNLTGNITLTMTNYSDYAVAKVQDMFITSSGTGYTITWQTGVDVTDFDAVPIDFSASTIVNHISCRCLNPTTPKFQMSNYLIP